MAHGYKKKYVILVTVVKIIVERSFAHFLSNNP